MNPIQLFMGGRSRGAFVSTWNTENLSGSVSLTKQVRLPTQITGAYNCKVDWGDGTSNQMTAYNQVFPGEAAAVTHTYTTAGTYTIKITGLIRGWRFNSTGDRNKILTIQSWGPFRLGNTVSANAFSLCYYLDMSGVSDVFNSSNTNDLSYMFGSTTGAAQGVPNFSINRFTEWKFIPGTKLTGFFYSQANLNQNLSALDVSNVIDTSFMFYNCNAFFTSDLSSWNMSGVTTMASMFQSAAKFNGACNWSNLNALTGTGVVSTFSSSSIFNQPINNWDVSRCTSLSNTFYGCIAFNQNINSWQVDNVTNMDFTFYNCDAFDQPLNNWNVSKVTTMINIFGNCAKFNQDITMWNTSSLLDLSSTFSYTALFNQPIVTSGSSWDVSKVTKLFQTFYNADVFNQNLNTWNTTSVNSMQSTFNSTNKFNNGLPLGDSSGALTWDTHNVTDFSNMFLNAIAFACDISGFNTSKATNMQYMFSGANKFNKPLITNGFLWDTSKVTTMFAMFNNATLFNQNINTWNTSAVTTMGSMFAVARDFNQPLNTYTDGFGTHWDVLNVTDFSSMFQQTSNFNQDLNNWNTIKAIDMSSMFYIATAFNKAITFNTINVTNMASMFRSTTVFNNGLASGIGGSMPLITNKVTNMNAMFLAAIAFNQALTPSGNIWNTGLVTDMTSIFSGATVFNNGLASGVSGVMQFDISNATTLGSMFLSCPAFNQDVSGWNPVKVTTFNSLFNGCSTFNQPVGLWGTKTGLVTNMNGVFQNCNIFNNGQASGAGGVMQWDVSKVTTFQNMFSGASAFNQDISGWNTIAAASAGFTNMFTNAIVFNQNIGNWNTANALDMLGMFTGATAFNQDIGNWNVGKCTRFTNFMNTKTPATFSAANLDAIYNGWTRNLLQPAVTGGISFGTAKATAAGGQGRALLTRANVSLAALAIQSGTGGVFRLQTSAHGLITGNKVLVNGVTNYPTANGLWTITVLSTVVIELQGSVFAGSGNPNGAVRTGYGWTVTDGSLAVTGAINNGSGLIRITTAVHGLTTGAVVFIYGVLGTTNANGTWTVTVISTTQFDLQTSVFNAAFTSGGVVVG